MKLKTNYEIVNPPEPAMAWKDYEAFLKREWNILLQAKGQRENQFQKFLEKHPSMLPWTYYSFQSGHHRPFPGAVISQPVLPGLSSKIPDFMWLTSDSMEFTATLIEIEAPDKPWATKQGQPSHELTQAMNQIHEWQSWFSDPINVQQFKRDYHITLDRLRGRTFVQKYILIYGRRSDPTLTDEVSAKRSHLCKSNEDFMTYDRLGPNSILSQCLTVKLVNGAFEALEVPPTTELSPGDAEYWSIIRKKAEAVKANPLITSRRQDFLVERWPYWDNWAREDQKGVIIAADRE